MRALLTTLVALFACAACDVEVIENREDLDPNGDIDEDGLTRAFERALGTDPDNADSDDDGLADGAELAFGTDPKLSDTDGDQLGDLAEQALGTDGRGADSDGDGIADGPDAGACDALSFDADQDALSDLDEVSVFGTDCRNPDTDGDQQGDAEDPAPLDPNF